MMQPNTYEKAIDTLLVINRAVVHVKTYPSNHPLIIKIIDTIYEFLMIILDKEDALTFAESGRELIISGERVRPEDPRDPYIAIFLMLMINWRIKSIIFKRGLGKSEIMPFLEIIAKKPGEVVMEGEFEKLVAERKMPHILFNQKIDSE